MIVLKFKGKSFANYPTRSSLVDKLAGIIATSADRVNFIPYPTNGNDPITWILDREHQWQVTFSDVFGEEDLIKIQYLPSQEISNEAEGALCNWVCYKFKAERRL